MKKHLSFYVNLLLGILLVVNMLLKYPGRDYVFMALLTALAVNATIKRLPNIRKNYAGEIVLRVKRARINWLLFSIAALLVIFVLLFPRKRTSPDFLGYMVCLFVLSDAFVYYFNRRYKSVLFVINGKELIYTLNTGKAYDATALIQISKRIMLFERIYILTFDDDSEIEFDSRQFRKEDLKNFLEVLIQKSRFKVDVNAEIQQHYNLVVSADGIRKPRPGIYGQFADEPFDLADFDAISVRWREAGMAYSDAVKLVMEKTGMLMGDARNAVEASAGWNR